MWAQLIKARAKPGKEDELRRLPEEFDREGIGLPGSMVQILSLENENDPGEHYTLIVFESEEKARENERSPEQAKRLERIRELYDGQPEYVDLNVIYQRSR